LREETLSQWVGNVSLRQALAKGSAGDAIHRVNPIHLSIFGNGDWRILRLARCVVSRRERGRWFTGFSLQAC
jgi:hypothetical protein